MRFCDQCHTDILDYGRSVTNIEGVFCTAICAQIMHKKLLNLQTVSTPIPEDIPVRRVYPKINMRPELKGFLEGVCVMGVIMLILRILEAGS